MSAQVEVIPETESTELEDKLPEENDPPLDANEVTTEVVSSAETTAEALEEPIQSKSPYDAPESPDRDPQ